MYNLVRTMQDDSSRSQKWPALVSQKLLPTFGIEMEALKRMLRVMHIARPCMQTEQEKFLGIYIYRSEHAMGRMGEFELVWALQWSAMATRQY